MPRAPIAKGRGRGRGAPTPKAQVIARPSHDYQWKIDHRTYGTGDEKERREELRRQAAEARQKAREEGEEVDVGRDGDYWKQIAENNKQRAPVYRNNDSRDGWARYGTVWRAAQVTQAPVGSSRDWNTSAQSQTDSRHWQQHDDRRSPFKTSENHWQQHDDRKSAVDTSGKHWQHDDRWNETALDTSGDSGSVAGDGYSATDRFSESDNTSQKDWGTSASRSRYPAQMSSSSGSRSFTPESKARREEMRKREAEARRLRLEAEAVAEERAAAPSAASAASVASAASAAAVPSPDPPKHMRFDFAKRGLQSQSLQAIITEAEQALSQSLVGKQTEGIDLSGNELTDEDLANFVSFMQAQGIRADALFIQRNLLINPQSLIDLLGDPHVGLAAGCLRELRLSASGISKECCWRICEKASRLRPQPPLHLVLTGNSENNLEPVFEMAVKKYGAQISGIEGGVSKEEAHLLVELLTDEDDTESLDATEPDVQEGPRYQ